MAAGFRRHHEADKGEVMAQGATFLWLSLMVISALPLLADGGWDRKSSARRRGTSSLVTSDLAALGGRLADRVRSPLQAPPTTAARRRAAGAAPASWRLHWRHGGDTPACRHRAVCRPKLASRVRETLGWEDASGAHAAAKNSHRRKRRSRVRETSLPIENSLLV